MGLVIVKASGYANNYNHLNGERTLNISNCAIARGIVTIGKTHWLQYFQNPIEILNDFVHHVTGLNTFLTTERGNLVLTSRFSQLDQSEQRIKSYNIGMGLSKIVGDKVLNVPHLQHVDYLVEQGIIELGSKSKQRGDMIGRDNLGNWHVLEAKGRSNQPTSGDFREAKRQSRNIVKINNVKPITSNYCVSFINMEKTITYLADPEEDEQGINVEIDEKQFIISYYKKLFEKLSGTEVFNIKSGIEQIDDLDPVYYKINDSFVLGVLPNIIRDIRNNRIDFTERSNNTLNSLREITSDDVSAGSDGIILIETPGTIIFPIRNPEKPFGGFI
jgi:hypothetical protein